MERFNPMRPGREERHEEELAWHGLPARLELEDWRSRWVLGGAPQAVS